MRKFDSIQILFLTIGLSWLTSLWAQTQEVKLGQVISKDELKLLSRVNVGGAWGAVSWISQRVGKNKSSGGEGSIIPGSREEREMAQYLKEQLTRLGYSPSIEEFPVVNHQYLSCRLKFGKRLIDGVIYGDSPGTFGTLFGSSYKLGNFTGGDEVYGDLVNGGRGTKEELDGLGNIQAKIVLLKRDDSVTGHLRVPLAEIKQRGAIAVIAYGVSDGVIQVDAIRQDSVQSPIPIISISLREASQMQKELAEGVHQVTFRAEVKIEKARSVNIVAVQRGKVMPDDVIVVGAHLDRYFEGAHKSAAGLSTLLELARLFSQNRYQNNRSLIFVAFSGSNGSGSGAYANWNRGSFDFISKHQEVKNDGVFYIDLNSIGGLGKRGILSTTERTIGFVKELAFDMELKERYEVLSAVNPRSDAFSFWFFGSVPFLSFSRTGLEPITELTDQDVMEELSRDNFADDLKVAAMMIYRMDNKIVLPFVISSDLITAQKNITQSTAFFNPALKEKTDVAIKNFSFLLQKIGKLENIMAKLFPKQELGNVITTKKYSENLLSWSTDFNTMLKKLKNAVSPIFLASCGDKPADMVCPIFQNETSQIQMLKKVAYALATDDIATARSALVQIPSLGWGKHVQEKTYADLRQWFDRETAWYNPEQLTQSFPPPSVYSLLASLNALPRTRLSKGRGQENFSAELALIEKMVSTLQKKLEEELLVFEKAIASGVSILDEFFAKYKDRLNEGPQIWEVGGA
jgi:Iap family predicted aminopeptidase